MPVADDRAVRVAALIAQEPAPVGGAGPLVDRLQRLCAAAVRALPAKGAGVSLMTADGARGVAAASDTASEVIEDLQFTVGVGPCIDAFSSRQPVLEPNLDDGALARWPGYTDAALEHGVHAVFAFPLQVGAARLGILDLYQDRPGSLSPDWVAEALTFAAAAVTIVLDSQEEVPADKAVEGLEADMGHGAELYQAQGMVMIQLGSGLADAMVRLRAYAYAQDRPLGDVARDVIARRLRLDRDQSP